MPNRISASNAHPGKRRIAPTQERCTHGFIERTEWAIKVGVRLLRSAASGRPADPAYGMFVGWQQSLKEWALEQGWNGRRVSQEAASGILIASLGTLEAHFAQSRRC